LNTLSQPLITLAAELAVSDHGWKPGAVRSWLTVLCDAEVAASQLGLGLKLRYARTVPRGPTLVPGRLQALAKRLHDPLLLVENDGMGPLPWPGWPSKYTIRRPVRKFSFLDLGYDGSTYFPLLLLPSKSRKMSTSPRIYIPLDVTLQS